MLYQAWKSWIDAFEHSAAGGDWSEAAERLSKDCLYVVAGGPYAAEIRGRDAVIAGFERSFAHFDERFDRRDWRAAKVRLHEPNAVSAVVAASYEMQGVAPLRFGVDGHWIFDGDRVSVMVDVYDFSLADTGEAAEWLERHAERLGLDASYR